MPEAEENVDDRLKAVEATVSQHATLLTKHERLITDLDGDVEEIHALLGTLATREDMVAIKEHVDHSVNGVLRDALNASPAWMTALLTAVLAIAAVGGWIISNLHP